MTKKYRLRGRKPRRILGFSLPPELADEVKKEAEMRSIKLRNLFIEIWEIYKKNKTR
jgi:hypothetical protein